VGYYVVDEVEPPPPPPHLHHHSTTTQPPSATRHHLNRLPPPPPPPPPHHHHTAGIGISFAYAAAAMNEIVYTGGYMKGHFALVGVTDNGDVQPEPAATLWGDTASEVQVARTSLNPL
jgi:hypothetical protein